MKDRDALVHHLATLAQARDPSWRALASCRGMSVSEFGDQPTALGVAACGRCEVRRPCLADEARFPRDEVLGYRGGLTLEVRVSLVAAVRHRLVQASGAPLGYPGENPSLAAASALSA